MIEMVTCWPPRSTTHDIVAPLLSRMAAVTWSHVLTAFPSTERMRSRSCSPAALAGATGSPGLHSGCGTCTVGAVVGTHAESSPTLGATCGRP